MKVQVGDQDFVVSWHHERDPEQVLHRISEEGLGFAYPIQAITSCQVTEPFDDVDWDVTVGRAYCPVGVNFDRALGRKLSLHRALVRKWGQGFGQEGGALRPEKAIRTAFWDAYFTRSGFRGYRKGVSKFQRRVRQLDHDLRKANALAASVILQDLMNARFAKVV